MDTNDILKATQSTKRLIQDSEYYRHIFKKTERIVSVVFYIIHTIKDSSTEQSYIDDLQKTAQLLHNAVLESLESRAHVAEEAVRKTAHALVVLQSKLTVAQAASVITSDVLLVLTNEIDSVLRSLTSYLGEEPVVFDQTSAALNVRKTDRVARANTKSSPASVPTDTTVHSSVKPLSNLSEIEQRQAQIKAIIETRGEVTIKDVSAIITDISEKTIQRELNTMIDNNIIKRIGKRRWSRYVPI